MGSVDDRSSLPDGIRDWSEGGMEKDPISWVGPPLTNSGIIGMYRDCGHYYWVGAQPNLYHPNLSTP